MPVTNSNTQFAYNGTGFKALSRTTAATSLDDAMGYEADLTSLGIYQTAAPFGSFSRIYAGGGYILPNGGDGAFDLTINENMSGLDTLIVQNTSGSYGNDFQGSTIDDVDYLTVRLPAGWTYQEVGTVMVTNSVYRIPGFDYTNASLGQVRLYDENNNLALTLRLTGWESKDNKGLSGIFNPCFTSGAQVLMEDGSRVAVEKIQAGDLVMTKDHGPQIVRAVLCSPVSHEVLNQFPERRPVRIPAGSLGNHEEHIVSPQHRVLMKSDAADILFDSPEVLVAAKDLIDGGHAEWVDDCNSTVYYHVICDRHEILNVDGVWSESFQVGEYTLSHSSESVRKEIVAIFPELSKGNGSLMASARTSMRRSEVKVIGLTS